jgi:hypothetical protein
MNAALDPAPAPPAHGEADEQLLHAVRRADWRFLLPDAHLGRVAYAAPHDPELVRALELVAGQLRLTEPDGLDAAGADVVVATGAAPQAAARLAAGVRPGGWLYAEARGVASGRWATALRGAGFEDVDVFWLWPDAGRVKEMVALGDSHAVRHALGRRDPGARLRLRAWAARSLLATGLLRLVVPSVAIVGRRRVGGQDSEGA